MNRKLEVRISVDPGIGTTGFAVWENHKWEQLCEPIDAGILTGKSNPDWKIRASNTADQFAYLLGLYDVKEVYMELPTFMQGDAKAMAANAEDSIIKLSIMVGMLWRTATVLGVHLNFTPVKEWKGQLPKSVVASRIASKLSVDVDKYHSHSNDAVGIGLHAKGFWVTK